MLRGICISLVLLTAVWGQPTNQKRSVNYKNTSRNIFTLSLITAIPVTTFSLGTASQDFRREYYFSSVVFSIPAMVGWPLFIREMRNQKRVAERQKIEARMEKREQVLEDESEKKDQNEEKVLNPP